MATPIACAAPGGRAVLAAALAEAGFALDEPTDLEEWLGRSGVRVLLIPIRSPSDVEQLMAIRAAHPGAIVVAELPLAAAHTFRDAIRAGAHGAVPANASPGVVGEVVRAALTGQVLVPLALLRTFLHS